MIEALLAAYLVFLVFLGLLILARLFHLDFFNELLSKENPAIAIVYVGFAIGVAWALSGLFFGSISSEWSTSLSYWALEGVLALCLVILTAAMTDRLLLPRFPVAKEIKDDRNLGVACVVAAACLSAGLVINGAICGYSDSIPSAIRDIVIYWGLGQAAIWLTLRAIVLLRPFDFVRQLEEDDNLASGMSLGFFVVSLGVLARSAVIRSGGADVWGELGGSLTRFLLSFASLLVVLSALKLLLRRRGVRIVDLELANSPAPIMMWGGLQIALALIIGLVFQRPG